MTWFEKIIPSRIKTERRTRSVPEGLWMKCPACDSVLYRPEVERNLQVCPKCAHHMRIGARERLTQFLDPDSAVEIGANTHMQTIAGELTNMIDMINDSCYRTIHFCRRTFSSDPTRHHHPGIEGYTNYSTSIY